MSDYSQPEFYRFNEDSLQLVRWIIDEGAKAKSLLDLGAGCGIIGCELARALEATRVHFLELQPEFESFLKVNLQFLPPSTFASIEINSFKSFIPTQKFDLIVSNPPYYLPHAGQRSADPRRDRSRSFLVDDWFDLMAAFRRSLSVKGRGHLVMKKDSQIEVACLRGIEKEALFHEQEEKGELIWFKLWIE